MDRVGQDMLAREHEGGEASGVFGESWDGAQDACSDRCADSEKTDVEVADCGH